VDIDLTDVSGRELLRLYARVLEALREKKIVKTSNNPVADYAELLVCRALGLRQLTNSNKGFDAEDPTTSERYEIKARRSTIHHKPTRLSPLRDFEEQHFHFLVVVILRTDFAIERAIRIPWSAVEAVSRENRHVNGRIVFLGEALWNAPEALDITDRLRSVEGAL
jgi:hypothetical protein